MKAQQNLDADGTGGAVGWSSCFCRHKTWALALILLLALWSMLAASAGLARSSSSSSTLVLFGGSSRASNVQDVSRVPDALEMEMRERMVRQAWDGYRYKGRLRLASFWHDALEAAFEEMDSDDARVREAAITHIAHLSASEFQLGGGDTAGSV